MAPAGRGNDVEIIVSITVVPAWTGLDTVQALLDLNDHLDLGTSVIPVPHSARPVVL